MLKYFDKSYEANEFIKKLLELGWAYIKYTYITLTSLY